MAKKKSKTAGMPGNHDEQPVDFEESLGEVESIVSQLESGELGLTESLQKYEQGIRELKQCQSLLDKAEQKISTLSGFDADGNPVSTPTDNNSAESDDGGKRKKLRVKKKSASSDSKTSPSSAAIQADSSESSVDDSPGLF
jgi:exodeoxyribonuclease VII small subunit